MAPRPHVLLLGLVISLAAAEINSGHVAGVRIGWPESERRNTSFDQPFIFHLEGGCTVTVSDLEVRFHGCTFVKPPEEEKLHEEQEPELSLELLPAASGCTGVVCATSIFLGFSTHTWIGHSCAAPIVVKANPWTWTKVGFEATNNLPIGPGALRMETYSCSDPRPSSVTTDACSRASIQTEVKAGWNGPGTKYRIWKGAKTWPIRADCGPDPSGNVCWWFTQANTECARQQNPQVCPPPITSLAAFRNATGLVLKDSAPATWTCPRGWYGEGKFCDCHCGAFDPDCLELPNPSRGCNGTDVCLFPGDECMARNLTLMDRKLNRLTMDGLDVFDYDYTPQFAKYDPALPLFRLGGELWDCPFEYYGSGDGCDAAFCHGLLKDPDCAECWTEEDPDCQLLYSQTFARYNATVKAHTAAYRARPPPVFDF